MITYYGYTISPNQLETGEGFLICRNVPIARTGTQDYTGAEVGRPDEAIVKVNRPEEEVFSPAAMSSFEGKPFTDDHPPVLLNPDNVGAYEKGHVQNVRRGSGEFADFLIADIHVHDAATIQAIRDGKRQISCGYEVEYDENPDGTMTQRKIRGNHVALVPEGRAGSKAAIMDSNNTQAAEPPERKRKPMSKKASILSLFGLAANGRSEEEIRRIAEDAAVMMDEDTAPEHEPEGEPVPEEDAKPAAPAIDVDALAKAISDAVIAALAPQKAEEPEEEKDPLDVALETIGKEIKGEDAAADEDPAAEPGAEDESTTEQEEAHVVPAEEMDKEEEKTEDACSEDACSEDACKDACKDAMDAQTARSLILTMRPAIAAIKDEAERKAVTDALLSAVQRPAVSDTAKIVQTAARNAAFKQSKAPKTDLEAIQALYDARNPHLRKENK